MQRLRGRYIDSFLNGGEGEGEGGATASRGTSLGESLSLIIQGSIAMAMTWMEAIFLESRHTTIAVHSVGSILAATHGPGCTQLRIAT